MLIEKIGTPSMLEQTAEECSELAQACLKMARFMRGENPTTKKEYEITANLEEEMADVLICIDELYESFSKFNVDNWIEIKQSRLKDRFKNQLS